MKKNFKKICYLVLINTAMILNISSCTTLHTVQNDLNEATTKTKIKMGIALYNAEDAFIQTLYNAINHYAEVEQSSGDVEISFTMADAQNNQETQNAQIDQLIKEKCNVIMVNIVDRSQAATIINKAKSANIPLVFFNREPVPQDMEIWEKVYYVGAMAEQSGKMQAEILIQAIESGVDVDKNGDGIIQYVMIEGEPGHQDAILRTYHSIKVLEDRGYKTENLASDTGMWQKALAKQKMLEWIEKFNEKIEVVIANNDDMALGAKEALEANGYINQEEKVYIIGIDGLEGAVQAVKNGTMLGTVLNNSGEQARATFTKAYFLATDTEPKNVASSSFDGKYFRTSYEIISNKMLK